MVEVSSKQNVGRARPHAFFIALTALNLILFVGYFAVGSWLGYSFWLDELYSASAARAPLAEMLELIFDDLHPPLYLFILFGWIRIFGDSEFALRALSFLFGALAIASFWGLRAKLTGDRFWVAMCLFTSSVFLFFYANEVRNYSILLFFATLAMVSLVQGKYNRVVVVSLALGLTHFFGTLLAFALLVWGVFFSNSRSWSLTIKAGLALIGITAWPASQLLFGSTAEKIGGNFWIDSSPMSVFPHALEVAFTYLHFAVSRLSHAIGAPEITAAAFSLVFLMGLLALVVFGRRRRAYDYHEVLLKASVCFYLILISVAFINAHTPIGTPRNFIVLVPFGAVLATAIVPERESRLRRALVYAATLIAVGISHWMIYWQIGVERFTPVQNWKAMAAAAVEDAGPAGATYFFTDARTVSEAWKTAVFSFYLPDGRSTSMLYAEDVAIPEVGDIIMFGNVACEDGDGGFSNLLTDALDQAGRTYTYALPHQLWACSTGHVKITR